MHEACRTKTRVHAELFLVDLFYHEEYEFVDGDKYVGCSKPACHGCYQYILAMLGNFALPQLATHNNIYLTWRPPDVPISRGECSAKRRAKTMNTMNEYVRTDMIQQIRSRKPRSIVFDSASGFTSLLVQDFEVMRPKVKDLVGSSMEIMRKASLVSQSTNASGVESLLKSMQYDDPLIFPPKMT